MKLRILPHSQNLRMKIQFSPRVFPKNTLNSLVKIEFSCEDSESVEVLRQYMTISIHVRLKLTHMLKSNTKKNKNNLKTAFATQAGFFCRHLPLFWFILSGNPVWHYWKTLFGFLHKKEGGVLESFMGRFWTSVFRLEPISEPFLEIQTDWIISQP